jgi:predicted Zn-ribbon and HTH transcriptional regulator
VTTEGLITAYVMVLLAGIAALALYSEHRRRRFSPAPSADHIFRCEKCSFVYTDDDDVDRSRCPQCGAMNEEIKF